MLLVLLTFLATLAFFSIQALRRGSFAEVKSGLEGPLRGAGARESGNVYGLPTDRYGGGGEYLCSAAALASH